LLYLIILYQIRQIGAGKDEFFPGKSFAQGLIAPGAEDRYGEQFHLQAAPA